MSAVFGVQRPRIFLLYTTCITCAGIFVELALEERPAVVVPPYGQQAGPWDARI